MWQIPYIINVRYLYFDKTQVAKIFSFSVFFNVIYLNFMN